MKLAGEFEFLGDAYRGDPEFDKPPPKGVVKLFYPIGDPVGDGEDAARERCGFFKCPWWRWGAFKEAATRLQSDRAARGIYPNASIVVISEGAEPTRQRKQEPGGR